MDPDVKPIRNGRAAKNRLNQNEEDVDEGWAWVVLVASFVVNIISLGTNFSLGVYYAEFLDYFEAGAVKTAFLISLSCALVLAAGPFAGVLANRFGARVMIICGGFLTATGFILSAFVTQFWMLFITFGFMTGFGSGLSYTPSFGVLPLYFRRRRNFATAIVTAGNGVGIFIFPVLFRYLIANYTWRGAMFVNAGIALNVIPCGAAIFKKPPRSQSSGFAQFLDVSLFREPGFYYSLMHLFLCGSNYIFNVLCIRYAIENVGISKDASPILLSVNGATNIAGRSFSALLSSFPKIAGVNTRYILSHIFGVGVALSIAGYAWCTSFTTICVAAGFVGLCWGTRFALVPGLTLDLLGAKRFNTAWGYVAFCLGVAFLTFPPLGGFVGTESGNMDNAFYLSGAASGLAVIFSLVLHYETRRKMKLEQQNQGSPLTIVRPRPTDEA